MAACSIVNDPVLIAALKVALGSSSSSVVTSGTMTFIGSGIANLTVPYKQYVSGTTDKICTIFVGTSSLVGTTAASGINAASTLVIPGVALGNCHSVISVFNGTSGLSYTAEVAIADNSNNILLLFNTLGLVMTLGDKLAIFGFGFSFPLQ